MSSHGLLISLSGIDGAGKSNVADRIRDILLADYGIPSRYLWCKFGDHPLSRYRLGKLVKHRRTTKSGQSHRRSMPSFAFRLYSGGLLAFHLAQIAFAVRASLRRGLSVVCDRYIFDTMVDLQQDLQYSKPKAVGTFGAKWIPMPDSGFLLDLEAETAFARKTDSASLAYLKERRAMYRQVADEYGLTIVDASQSIEEVVRSVMQQVTKGLGRGAR